MIFFFWVGMGHEWDTALGLWDGSGFRGVLPSPWRFGQYCVQDVWYSIGARGVQDKSHDLGARKHRLHLGIQSASVISDNLRDRVPQYNTVNHD